MNADYEDDPYQSRSSLSKKKRNPDVRTIQQPHIAEDEEQVNFSGDEGRTELEIWPKSANSSDGKNVCRICLFDTNDEVNMLITPCKCNGTMQFIHVECLWEWLNSKWIVWEENENVTLYCFSWMMCELCKSKLPDKIIQNGKLHDICNFEIPKVGHYMILECYQ